jgi:hypothetical protein
MIARTTTVARLFVLACALATVSCSDSLAPDEGRYLGPLFPADHGLIGDNPLMTRLSGSTWRIRIVTAGACPMVRSEAEVIYRERVALVFPYEVRKLCVNRPLVSGTHEIDLSLGGEGDWAVWVMGSLGPQWADTVANSP